MHWFAGLKAAAEFVEQFFPIFFPIDSAKFVLMDVGTDEPIPQRQPHVDGLWAPVPTGYKDTTDNAIALHKQTCAPVFPKFAKKCKSPG